MASVPMGVILVVLADGGRARLAMVIFSIGLTAMLGVSAIVHSRDWGIEQVEALVRLDHTAIFMMFATTSTPIAMLVLDDPIATWLLAVAWVGAGIGIIAEWIPVHPPAGVVNGIYLGFGWSMLAFTPWMVAGLTATQAALLFGGGAAYTIGAVVVGARWPDPWTESFGYHEIWHVLVVVACGLHVAMAASIAW
ncbi:MAG: hemolysin III [Actinobacteria bacterium]|nr:hemolysin III [Actinomycetota bacterium]NIU20235.1 hemolysin III [Actinomycetota bacterium]NIV56699.1 hemolysin III [Actinomycetota bacterium]NIW29658.1 hemolysin III [Actinomycetota bacterium]NIX22156.1 hemolysin III [Actinomycetota bacterium]